MKVSLLGVEIDALGMEETVERVAGLINSGRPHRILTINPEFLYQAQFEERIMKLAQRADLITPDGIGIVWACRLAGFPVKERITGTDLMLRLVERASPEGWRVYLLGGAPGVAEEAAEKLQLQYSGLKLAGTHHGYFKDSEEELVVKKIKELKPHLLFVALGAPKQEIWIDQHIQAIGTATAIGVGGSFDVVSGRVERAPRWVRRINLEWLYRLLKEPSRWRRQAVLPLFAWLVIRKYGLRIP